MKQFLRASLLFIALAFFTQPLLFAQSPAVYAKMKEKYPDVIGVFLTKWDKVDLRLEGDSIKVQEHSYQQLLHLGDNNANILSEDEIYSSHFMRKDKLEAYTLVPEKRKFRKVPVGTFTEKDEQSSGIFYDDSRVTFFHYPNVQPGAITVKDYTRHITDPRFLTAFYFGSFIPTEETFLEVTMDEAISINFVEQNTEGYDIQMEKSRKDGRVTYRWTAREVAKIERESNAPKMSYFAPHIIYFIDHYTVEGEQRKVLSKVDDLYTMYTSFVKDLNTEPDPQLQSIVDSIVSDTNSELEKVKKIFYWVQDNIQYIAFEDGMRGFIPHNASLVFEKRYGDCKDMASITKSMLDMAGINNTYLTWIGSRDIPYKYTEVPTPQVDNHMIATWENEGQYYYLDATSKYTRFGLPSSMIQGKQALIAIDRNTFVIKEVPVIDASQNIISDSVHVSIAEGTLTGEGRARMQGYAQVFRSYSLSGLDKRTEERKVRALVTKGSNKFILDSYEINNLGKKDQPLTIDYTYSLADYTQQIDDEIYVNLNLERPFFNDLIDLDKRTLPQENDYYYTLHNKVVFEVPDNYSIDYLPASAKDGSSFFDYEIKYQSEGGQVIVDTKITVKYLLLEKTQFEEWNRLVNQLSDAYREVVILKNQDS